REHVLHPPEVDVADHRGLALLRDVMLYEDVVLEHDDLGAAVPLADVHLAFHRFTAGEEFGLGDDSAAAAGVAPFPAALTLRLQAGGPLQRGDLVAGRLAGVGAAAAAAAARARAFLTARLTLVLRRCLLRFRLCALLVLLIVVLATRGLLPRACGSGRGGSLPAGLASLATLATSAAAAAAAAATATRLVGFVVLTGVGLGFFRGALIRFLRFRPLLRGGVRLSLPTLGFHRFVFLSGLAPPAPGSYFWCLEQQGRRGEPRRFILFRRFFLGRLLRSGFLPAAALTFREDEIIEAQVSFCDGFLRLRRFFLTEFGEDIELLLLRRVRAVPPRAGGRGLRLFRLCFRLRNLGRSIGRPLRGLRRFFRPLCRLPVSCLGSRGPRARRFGRGGIRCGICGFHRVGRHHGPSRTARPPTCRLV